jgi:hypothetical protein
VVKHTICFFTEHCTKLQINHSFLAKGWKITNRVMVSNLIFIFTSESTFWVINTINLIWKSQEKLSSIRENPLYSSKIEIFSWPYGQLQGLGSKILLRLYLILNKQNILKKIAFLMKMAKMAKSQNFERLSVELLTVFVDSSVF